VALLANEIYLGSISAPLYYYSNNSLELGSANGSFSVDVLGNELSVDEFSFTVRYQFDANLIYAPRGAKGYRDANGKIYRLAKGGIAQYLRFVPRNRDALVDSNGDYYQVFAGYVVGNYLTDLVYGTPVYWYIGGAFFSKGYVKTVERIAKYAWKITCVSGIGLLDSKTHIGGIYKNASFYSIAKSIIGDSFSFSCDAAVKNVAMWGHLPYDTARNNLHRLLFAVGASIVRGTAANDYNIQFLTENTVSVPPDRISINGSVQTQLPSNSVEITEHAYTEIDTVEPQVLFDNTSGSVADHVTVTFQEPVFDLASETLTINESGANYAVVSGSGVLTGIPYTHTERIVSFDESNGEPVRVRRVTDNHLISFANSMNVARRVLSFYKSSRNLKAKIMLNGEKCGNNLDLFDAFGAATSGYLQKMTVLPTSVIGASCEIVEGYSPEGGGNNYTRYHPIYQTGTWNPPEWTKMMRILLVQGGTGGQGGFNGDGGYTPTYIEGGGLYEWVYRNQEQSSGGAGGKPGSPGKIAVYDIYDESGIESVSVTVGAKGIGGAYNGGLGTDGGETTAVITFVGGRTMTLSSADGAVNPNGYYSSLNAKTYAKAGVRGTDGGNGGKTDTIDYYGNKGGDGESGDSLESYAGGAGGEGAQFYGDGYSVWASGGGGGGAAMGHSGGAGSDASCSSGSGTGGDGGDGADALIAIDAEYYGYGGNGGNGGGGGGNAGGSRTVSNIVHLYPGDAGTGGKGSPGADGGAGIAVCYY